MKKTSRLEKKLKEITLLVVMLSSMVTTPAFCVVDNSTSKTTHESLISEMHEIKKDLKETKKEINEKLAYQMQCNEEAIKSVNTSLSGASYALTIFGIIVGSFGIIVTTAAVGLGVYIGIQVRRVGKLTKESRSIYKTHLEIRGEVEQLNENIKNNMSKLYGDLKREETKSLVERLVKVPEDIANLAGILASRDIPMEFFPKSKEAYKALLPQSKSPEVNIYRGLYLVLFFQHFPASALFDEDLQNEMEMKYGTFMEASFENDIIKTSYEFLKVCMDDGILNRCDKIKKYFIALSKSKHKDLAELHSSIYKTLSTKENRFNFYSILQSEGELKQISKIYGQHMLTDYKDASGNTESEEKVLQDIAKESEQEGGAQE